LEFGWPFCLFFHPFGTFLVPERMRGAHMGWGRPVGARPRRGRLCSAAKEVHDQTLWGPSHGCYLKYRERKFCTSFAALLSVTCRFAFFCEFSHCVHLWNLNEQTRNFDQAFVGMYAVMCRKGDLGFQVCGVCGGAESVNALLRERRTYGRVRSATSKLCMSAVRRTSSRGDPIRV
jgi:hypothetical protein